jgi:preprotein translocase subunit YajC
MSSNTETAQTQSVEVQTTQALPEAPSKMDSTWTSFVPMILIFAVFYFLLIRPQEKKRKEQEQLVSSVKKGENVVTNAGIHGKVTKVNESDSTIMLEIAEGVEIKISKAAILEITSRKAEQKTVSSDKAQEDVKTEKKAPTTKDLIKKKTVAKK